MLNNCSRTHEKPKDSFKLISKEIGTRVLEDSDIFKKILQFQLVLITISVDFCAFSKFWSIFFYLLQSVNENVILTVRGIV